MSINTSDILAELKKIQQDVKILQQQEIKISDELVGLEKIITTSVVIPTPINAIPTPINVIPTPTPINVIPTPTPINVIPTPTPINVIPTPIPVNSTPVYPVYPIYPVYPPVDTTTVPLKHHSVPLKINHSTIASSSSSAPSSSSSASSSTAVNNTTIVKTTPTPTNTPNNETPFNHVIPINLCKIGMKHHTIKDAIENNHPIEENLHVISVISNVCLFKKRYQLMREFMRRMEFENNVILYIVELAYENQPFAITSKLNPHHLQLRIKHALWHKENMINIGVRKLLPPHWKAFAWIDADIDFDNNDWALDTLKILNGARDIVQIFSHAIDMDANEETMNVYNSFSFQFCHGLPYSHKFPNYWHPGYAWACTRTAFEKMGGIFEFGILGASDHIMSFCLANKGLESINAKYSDDFKNEILKFQKKVKRFRLGYVPGMIRHFFHGSKVNRKYVERNEILLKYNYSPGLHIAHDANGVLIPSSHFSEEFLAEILNYFKQRNEDE
jgi:hypothetical protein